jgi:glycosyltransferase involved in cell wall biosynthesis
MISEKFPPFNASGSTRPFYFAKYLPEFGYEPQVLGASLVRGEERDEAPLAELPASVRVWRAPRLLYPLVAQARAFRKRAAALGRPADGKGGPSGRRRALDALEDLNWWLHWEADWAAPATLAGWLGSQRRAPDLIWATGPPFRGFVVAARLASWLNKPLVLDLRDPWTYGSLWNPLTPHIERAERSWAERVLGVAARLVFTSPLTLEAMHRRFPALPRERLVSITNGYDDTDVLPLRQSAEGKCLFRYVGVLNERRKPDLLLQAFDIAGREPGFRSSAALEFIGNAGGHAGKVSLAPGSDVLFRGQVTRAESLRYMFGSDVNVLLQTVSEGADVISGKAFDYLHAQKPVLAVVDPEGGDAWLMRSTGAGRIVAWTDVEAVAGALLACWRDWQAGVRALDAGSTSAYRRRTLTGSLAALFDEVLRAGPR